MQEEFEALRSEVLACRGCKLCETRTNVVFGVGNPQAKVMFIGEGPGENEDLTGEPFVGRGGQLLDKMLAHVGLSRHENIYIANMVKCRPPKNRDPESDELEACLDWLRRQTRLIRPRYIVCLGRVSACKLIDSGFKVTKQHGEFIQRGDVWMMGTYHPAALLRSPGYKPDALEDLLALRARLEADGLV